MEGQPRRFFQYLAGEHQGEIRELEKIEHEDDIVFLCFHGGERCNEEYVLPINQKQWNGKLMAEVENTKNVWQFEEKWVGRKEEIWSKPEESEDGKSYLVQPFVEGKKKTIPHPPKPSSSKFGQITSHVEPAKMPEPAGPDLSDPVNLMVEQSKKFDTEILLDMTASLPKKSLYDVVDESFENGGDKMIDFLVNKIDVELIKDALREALKVLYTGEGEIEKAPEPEPVDETTIFEPEVVEEQIIGEPMAAPKKEDR